MKLTDYAFYILLCACIAMASCREDNLIIPSDETDVDADITSSSIKGMYLLCQGNMGSNKCQLDYLDFSDTENGVRYLSNIFAERNPNTVKELGDVGNDMKVYGSKLWITVNCSNKVEVCQVSNTKKLAQIDIPNCRFLAFHKGFAYVSSFVGPVKIAGDAPIGKVYKVDTLSLKVVDAVEVGYQPEEMAVIGNSLFVANSGGYRAPNYDNTISEIDLTSFKEVRKIEVAQNLYRCRADKYGQLWVSSRGNYSDEKPALYYFADAKTQNTPTGSLPLSVT
ncbi:MAG: YncE family protein, partial [Prevotella sp.]|nr:YncE family protein [Prevotella sp.]